MKNILLLLSLSILFSCKTINIQSQEKISKKAYNLYTEATQDVFARKFDDAINKLNEAIRIEPTYLKANLELARLYQSHFKNYQKAIDIYTEVENIDGFLNTLYFNKGLCAYNLRNFELAKSSVNKFLDSENINSKNKSRANLLLNNISFVENAVLNPLTIEFKNLGPSINTENNEYFPSISSDNKFLYFTVKEVNDNYPNEDIYSSESFNNKWSNRIKLNKNINTTFNEGAHSITSSGKFLLFASDNYKNKNEGNFDVFISKKVGNEWKVPNNIGNIINSRYWESQPVLSSDSKHILFVSTRKTGAGGADIYISSIDENGIFSEVRGISENINTQFDEQRPFLHPDGKTLYFSSNGHPGMGGSDLFKSTLDENGQWTKPINLGYPINSSEDEFGIFVSSEGTTAYISSDREGGFGGQDIYSFEMPEIIKPELVSYIKGTISDQTTKNPINANIKLFDLETGKLYKSLSSDKLNGEYLATILGGKEYALVADAQTYLPFSKNISLKNIKKNEAFIFNIELNKIAVDKEFVLNNIFFRSNEFELLEISKTELNYFVSFLQKNIELRIEIGGHTDNIGSSSTNKILSEKRAQSVQTFLMENGISKDRIVSKGYGDSIPIENNDTEKGRSNNRRTSFKII